MTREIADSTQPCKTAAGPALPNPPLSALVHMTRFRLRLSVSVINLSFGSLLIRQQLLLLLCNWDTLPGATGQHSTQHTMEWQGVFTLVSAHPLEGERPTAHAAPPTIMHRALKGWSRGSYIHIHNSRSCTRPPSPPSAASCAQVGRAQRCSPSPSLLPF